MCSGSSEHDTFDVLSRKKPTVTHSGLDSEPRQPMTAARSVSRREGSDFAMRYTLLTKTCPRSPRAHRGRGADPAADSHTEGPSL